MDGGPGAWPEESVGAWFVIRTRSRQERILSRELCAQGVAHFLPLVTVARIYAGRKATVEAPLFAGCVFLRGRTNDVETVERTRRATEVVDIADQHRFERELRHVYCALHVDAPLNPAPYLREGLRVEVRDGPLRGLQGVIEHADRRERIILQVHVLGQAVSVEVDPSLVDALE